MKKVITFVILICILAASLASCSAQNAEETETINLEDTALIDEIYAKLDSFFSTTVRTVSFDERQGISESAALVYFCAKELGDGHAFIKNEYKEYVSDEGFTVKIPKDVVRNKLNEVFKVDFTNSDLSDEYILRRDANFNSPCEYTIEGISEKDGRIYVDCLISDGSKATLTFEKTDNTFRIISNSYVVGSFPTAKSQLDDDNGIDISDPDVFNELLKIIDSTSETFAFNEGDAIAIDDLLGYFKIHQLRKTEEYEVYSIPETTSYLIPTEIVIKAIENKFNVKVESSTSLYSTDNGEFMFLSPEVRDSRINIRIDDYTKEGDKVTIAFSTDNTRRVEIVDGIEMFAVSAKEIVLCKNQNGDYTVVSCNTRGGSAS